MKMVLNLKEILIRNFRSYGDYDTIVKLDGLGGTLIVGEKVEDPSEGNGAGKTSLLDSIIWCLFGRVPTRPKPGDSIVNWFNKQNCIVKITTTDGYVITRTRGVDGHDDLLVHDPDGSEKSLSTNPNTQEYLNKLFNLDYDIFMSSVFFAQFGTGFLELPEQKRKKALERMLHLTKYDAIAEVAKEKIAAVEEEQTRFKLELEQCDKDVLRVTNQIESTNTDIKAHEETRASDIANFKTELAGVDGKFVEKYAEANQNVIDAKAELETIKTYDISAIQLAWNEYKKIQDKLSEHQKNASQVMSDIQKLKVEKTTLEGQTFIQSDNSYSDNLKHKILELKDEYEKMPEEDIEAITAGWDKYLRIGSYISESTDSIRAMEKDKYKLQSEKELLQESIQEWIDKKGSICSECQQVVTDEHISTKTNVHEQRMIEIESSLVSIDEEINKISTAREALQKRNEKEKPKLSLREAQTVNKEKENKANDIESLESQVVLLAEQARDAEKKEDKRLKQIETIKEEITQLEVNLANINEDIDSTSQLLGSKKPEITVNEATLIKKQYDAKYQEIKTLQKVIGQLNDQKAQTKEEIKKRIAQTQSAANPYQKIHDEQVAQLDETKKNREVHAKKVSQYDKLINHLEYIRSSFSDRKKIKSLTIGKLIPYLNQRIAYYLEAFDCSSKIEFNAFLQLKSATWPYDQHSGGERKRLDVAVMLAIYDLHSSIYEQRCNMLVLDEVDGKLSPAGIRKFISLLHKEFIDNTSENKPRTLLIISHRAEMIDAFPNKITVTKEGDFTRISA